MTNKKRLLSIIFSCITFILFTFTSCNQATVNYTNIESQEWLSQVPEGMTVTNLNGEEKNVTFGFRKSAVINTLKTIRLDSPLEKTGTPAGCAYSVALQYPNVVIRYTFYETVLSMTVDGEAARAYTIPSDISEKIGQQLRSINPS